MSALANCFHERRESAFAIGMPARQSWSALNDIERRPKNALLVLFATGFIVLAENLKLPALVAFEQANGDLLGCLGARRLRRHMACDHARVGETGNKKMRGDAVVGLLTERLGEALCQRFDACLANIISGVARGLSDALFRAGVDDEARAIACNHRGNEALDAVQHSK